MNCRTRTVTRLLACWVFLFLCAGPCSAPAVEPDRLEQYLAAIQEKADQVQSFVSEFQQEKEMALFERPVIFSGRLSVRRPDRLRWEFFAPIRSALLFSGTRGARCDEQGRATVFNIETDPVMGRVATELWLWLGGEYDRLGKAYALEIDGQDRLVLTPRDPLIAKAIEMVRLTFQPESLQPELVEIVEPQGDVTRIRFSSYQTNVELDEHLFTSCKG